MSLIMFLKITILAFALLVVLGYGKSLQWRHNGRHGVSSHRRLGCLLNRLFRLRSKKTSKLRVTGLCVGNSAMTGEFPARHHGFKHYAMLLAVLTTWNIGQSAEFVLYSRVSSITPGPFIIGLTTVVGSFIQTAVWEIICFPCVNVRILRIPSLAGAASGSHWDITRITSGIHGITWADVWKKYCHVQASFSIVLRNLLTQIKNKIV